MAASGRLEWRDRAGRLRQRWERLQDGGGRGDAILLKASAALQSLDDVCAEEDDCSPCLRLYSQAVLDITYYEENLLVDEEFPGDDSLQKVRELLEMLSEPERLSGESQRQDLVLDVEVQECLHWRRGALLYMYCHTVGERERWMLLDPRTFHQVSLQPISDGDCAAHAIMYRVSSRWHPLPAENASYAESCPAG
ncbi:hypothetical protein GDO81_002824 [Engystomops pustulosus]|uniref:USP domain-containing protein n=1 Tax=Engystomops pustulosus TaxID=76066 RepID=A0AAV7DR47_ENGPU|nr:hypothetical protein GDO81_002824 [Engystomops pustulosus]